MKVWYIQHKYLLVAGEKDCKIPAWEKVKGEFMIRQNMKRLRLIAGLVCVAWFFCGCGQSHDTAARELLKTAEKRQSLADFSALIRECTENQNLSADIRKQCVLQASVIIQKHIVQSRSALDENAVSEIIELLSDDAVGRVMPVDSELAQVDEALQYIRVMRTQQRVTARDKKLRQLQEIFRECELQDGLMNEESLAVLSRMYPRVSPEVLKKHFAQYIEYGNLWLAKGPLDSHPDLQVLLKKNIVEGCARCRLSGKVFCQVCGGSGICRICKGSGYKSMHKEIQFSSGDRWSYQQGWREEHSRKSSSGEKLTECPKKCADCQGVGRVQQACEKCNGRKYILNRKLLAELLLEQFQQLDSLLSELAVTSKREEPGSLQ